MPKAKKWAPPVPPNFWNRAERAAEEGYVIQNKASGADWKQTSMFLRDLVAYATLAHRHGRGDFMFMGWQPHGAGEWTPTTSENRYRSGLMLSMVSQQGFLHLETQWKREKTLTTAGHVDLKLKNFWCLPVNSKVSYITPPIGGYTAHLSGCAAEFYKKPRPCIWMEDFACPGTRHSHDWNEQRRQKWLATFTSKGKPDWVCKVEVDVPDEKVWWYSFDNRNRASDEAPFRWGNCVYDRDTNRWEETTGREVRASRSVRMRERFRHWTTNPDEARYCIVLHNLPRTLGPHLKR